MTGLRNRHLQAIGSHENNFKESAICNKGLGSKAVFYRRIMRNFAGLEMIQMKIVRAWQPRMRMNHCCRLDAGYIEAEHVAG